MTQRHDEIPIGAMYIVRCTNLWKQKIWRNDREVWSFMVQNGHIDGGSLGGRLSEMKGLSTALPQSPLITHHWFPSVNREALKWGHMHMHLHMHMHMHMHTQRTNRRNGCTRIIRQLDGWANRRWTNTRDVAWRDVAWRDVTWRDVTWRDGLTRNERLGGWTDELTNGWKSDSSAECWW